MAYRVEIAKNAGAELEDLYLWVMARAPQRGAKWFNGLERTCFLSIDTRSAVPARLRASIRISQSGY